MRGGPTRVRPPAVAGTFYPADPGELRALISQCFDDAASTPVGTAAPSALVVPHAGYIYSGPIAASAYRRIEAARSPISRVVLLGPSHRVPLRGMGLTSADVWATPLGDVPIDHAANAELIRLSTVDVNDIAHAPEHSLEVQLPFLQTVLGEFSLVPLVVGSATPDEVASAIDVLWGGHETLVVVSTDLSHYHRYEDAVRLDTRTAGAVTQVDPDAIADDDACGARPLRGLLRAAQRRHLGVEQIDLRNSGDTAGDHERVVGYGAFVAA